MNSEVKCGFNNELCIYVEIELRMQMLGNINKSTL